jgi:hypothetical protein
VPKSSFNNQYQCRRYAQSKSENRISFKTWVPAAMSRHWRMVSKAIQKLAVGLHEIKSEGMFPYETYYVLATDKELEQLYDREQ